MKKCIILANGHAPSKNTIKFLTSIGYSTLLCADGGANTAYRLGIIPELIIGDLDSIDVTVLNYFKNQCKIIKISRQNDNDVEKCLKYAIKENFEEVVLLGATGDRLDHSFCNIVIFLKFYDKIRMKIIHQKSLLAAYSGNVNLRTMPGETVSIYGIDNNTKFTSRGLKYSLKNVPLPFGVKESTSNVATSSEIKLKISGGKGIVIRDYQTLKKNGLI